jgi:hypothetical protein
VGTGDVQTTVYGIRVDVMDAIFSMMLQTNSFNIDLGVIIGNYNTIDLDMGYTSPGLGPLVRNNLDFGTI